MDFFNPNLKEWLEAKEKEGRPVTLVGLAWAGSWRLYLVLIGVSVMLALISFLFL